MGLIVGLAAAVGFAGLLGVRVKQALGKREAVATERAAGKASGARAEPSRTTHPVPTRWVPRVDLTGSLKPWRDADMGFETAGRLVRVSASVGDKVGAGQVLAVLDASRAAAQVGQAESQVAGATASLALAQDNLKRTESLAASKSVPETQAEQARRDPQPHRGHRPGRLERSSLRHRPRRGRSPGASHPHPRERRERGLLRRAQAVRQEHHRGERRRAGEARRHREDLPGRNALLAHHRAGAVHPREHVALPKDQRTAGLAELRDVARQTIRSTVPGARVVITDPPFVEGGATEAAIMVQVRGPDYDTLAPLARQFESALKGLPGITDVDMKYTPGQPELRVAVDRDRAARAGVPVSGVALALRAAIEGDEAGSLRQGKDDVKIRVRLAKGDRATMESVLQMTIWTPKGPVALADLASVEHGEGPSAIEREDRERQIMIWAAPSGRSLGELAPEIRAAFAKIPLPPGASFHLDGQIREMEESNSAMGVAFLLALVFIYIVLASQFESFLHPITIMVTTLPLAAVGAVVGVFLSGTTLAMGSFIGIIFLLGLVTKNAILVVDRAIVRVRDRGETPLQAILEAGPERLRPILMTSAAMVLGMLPTALGRGEGSEFRAPMAIAVIGGVVSSTILSLVVVPAFYLAVEGLKARVRGRRGLPPEARREPPLASPAE